MLKLFLFFATIVAALLTVAVRSVQMIWSTGLFGGLSGWAMIAAWFSIFVIEAAVYTVGLLAAAWLIQRILLPGATWASLVVKPIRARTQWWPNSGWICGLMVVAANLFFVVSPRTFLVTVLGTTELQKKEVDESAEISPVKRPEEPAPSAHRPVSAKDGLSVLKAAAALAIDYLGQRQVYSLAYPGQLVADVADGDLAVMTVLAELPFECSPFDSGKTAAEQRGCLAGLLKKVGKDPSQFHNPAQIESSTLGWIEATYPAAGLDDFETACLDLTVAFVVVFLHHDYSEAALSPAAKGLIKSEAWRRRALEAAYNTHVDHVSAAIARHGTRWREPGHGLPETTQKLLRKFIWIEANLALAVPIS